MSKKNSFPAQNELVFCTVKRITPYAAWCDLDEYSAEGMIHISEVAGKWVHDIRDFVKPNKQYVAKVMRVEPEKGIVSLSLKRVSKKEEKDKFNYSRRIERVNKMLEQVASAMGKKVDEAYSTVGSKLEEKFGDMFSAFEEIRDKPEILEELKIPAPWRKPLTEIIAKNFKEKETILKIDMEAKSFAADGLEKVRSILKEAQAKGSGVRYISAGNYRMEIKTKSPKNEEKKIRERLDKLVESAKASQVELAYKIVKE
jgi:translation initiation factor 2 alpha subunit (eIF-2alpha)